MHYDIHLSESYDGLAAETWALMGGNEPGSDLLFFEDAIRTGGGRALDLTCGSGKHLIPYLKAGLEVEGVDASQPLLELCRSRAAEIGKTPALYCQSMQALDLPHRYQTIFLSAGSFMLLKEREDAMNTLRGCYNHLPPGGKLYISMFRPKEATDSTHPGRWVLGPKIRPEDGAEITIKCWNENVDHGNQLVTQRRRYTVKLHDKVIRTQEAILYLRWYGKDELLSLFEIAGFSDLFIHQGFSSEAATEWNGDLVFRGAKLKE